MANQIKKKYLGNDQVSSEKILLENNTALRAKDSTSSTQDLLKIDGDNKVIIYRESGSEEIAYKSDVDGSGQALQDHIDQLSDAHNASAISIDPIMGLMATDVQGVAQAFQDHKDQLTGAHAATAISIDPIMGMMAVDVQGGLQAFQDHKDALTGAHAASAISLSPVMGLMASDVQQAVSEIQGEIDALSFEANAIGYNNSTSGLTATDVQGAIDEIDGILDGVADTYVNVSGDSMTGALTIDMMSKQLSIYSETISNNSSMTVSAENDLTLYSASGAVKIQSSASVDVNNSIQMNGNTIYDLGLPSQNGQPLIYDQLGQADGVAPLNSSSKIDSIYLPSYVDDVVEVANFAALPAEGETGKIYVALDNNKTYRWGGSAYFEVSPSEVNSVNGATGIVVLDTDDVSEGSVNKYYSESLFSSSFGGKSTSDLAEGSNLYYTQARFDSALSAKDTDDLSEGSSNLYFTESRAKQAAVSDAIVDNVTDVAPSQNAVFDALALKLDSSNFNSSFDTQLATKDTDDLAEGSSNLYFTEARAKSAAVSDSSYGAGWDGVTDVAPSKNAVYDEMQLAKGRLDSLEAVSPQVYKVVLTGTDISNEYIDLPHEAIQTNDFHVFVDRLALHQGSGEDYTLSVVSGVTRITFLNEMLSGGSQPLASGDSIYVRYKK